MILTPFLAFVVASQAPDFAKELYPLAPAQATPEITIDTTDLPSIEPWARQAQRMGTEWYPILVRLLATQDFKSPKSIKFVFKKDLNVPAYAADGTITINGKWVTENPGEGFGAVIHELTHIIQSYPDNKADVGWLVEGIADYVRWFRFEPDATRPRIDPAKAKYTDAYRTTAAFLAWITGHVDHRIVPMLDAKLRRGEDPMPVFQSLTGRTADDLWQEFLKGYPPVPAPVR